MCGSHSQSGYLGEEKNYLPLPGIVNHISLVAHPVA